MAPTLEEADRILSNKLVDRKSLPSRGDIIIFPSAAVALDPGVWPDVLIKRVIGLPGDRVEIHGGTAVINGWPVPACDAGQYLDIVPDGSGATIQGHLVVEFLGKATYLTIRTPHMLSLRSFVVGPGEVFVLGDNRGNSLDSRAWNSGRGGGVPIASIDGRAQWFLVGTRRDGTSDFGRLFHPLDATHTRLQIEGTDAPSLDEGIARCMRERVGDTTPPPPIATNR